MEVLRTHILGFEIICAPSFWQVPPPLYIISFYLLWSVIKTETYQKFTKKQLTSLQLTWWLLPCSSRIVWVSIDSIINLHYLREIRQIECYQIESDKYTAPGVFCFHQTKRHQITEYLSPPGLLMKIMRICYFYAIFWFKSNICFWQIIRVIYITSKS